MCLAKKQLQPEQNTHFAAHFTPKCSRNRETQSRQTLGRIRICMSQGHGLRVSQRCDPRTTHLILDTQRDTTSNTINVPSVLCLCPCTDAQQHLQTQDVVVQTRKAAQRLCLLMEELSAWVKGSTKVQISFWHLRFRSKLWKKVTIFQEKKY